MNGTETNKTALERAFELAQSGAFYTVTEIIQKLKDERYATVQVTGPTLYRQLRDIIEKRKTATKKSAKNRR
jgi:hypothetical protein